MSLWVNASTWNKNAFQSFNFLFANYLLGKIQNNCQISRDFDMEIVIWKVFLSAMFSFNREFHFLLLTLGHISKWIIMLSFNYFSCIQYVLSKQLFKQIILLFVTQILFPFSSINWTTSPVYLVLGQSSYLTKSKKVMYKLFVNVSVCINFNCHMHMLCIIIGFALEISHYWLNLITSHI